MTFKISGHITFQPMGAVYSRYHLLVFEHRQHYMKLFNLVRLISKPLKIALKLAGIY